VPDIYDSAKYDAIHNAHLDLAVMPDLYQVARVLANAVIPNECVSIMVKHGQTFSNMGLRCLQTYAYEAYASR
jgi:hypothetical protein